MIGEKILLSEAFKEYFKYGAKLKWMWIVKII